MESRRRKKVLQLPNRKRYKKSQLKSLEDRLELRPRIEYSEFWKLYEYSDAIMTPELESLVWEVHRIKVIEYVKDPELDYAPGFVRFLDDAIRFYKGLVARIRVRAGGILEDMPVWDNENIDQDLMEVVRDSCRLLLMHVADLARYKFLCSKTESDGHLAAQFYYEEAYQIDYAFGEAHNEIGTLMLSRGQYPGALYHFVRGIYVGRPSSSCLKNIRRALGLEPELEEDEDEPIAKPVFAEHSQADEFSLAFRDLVRAQLPKGGRRSSVTARALHQVVVTFPRPSCTRALYAVCVLLALVDNYYTGVLGIGPGPGNSNTGKGFKYLDSNLMVLLKFGCHLVAVAAEERDKASLPAVGILFLWLARHPETVRAMLETDEVRDSFKCLVMEVEKLLLGFSLKLEDNEPLSQQTYMGYTEGLWEDEDLRGCTLIFKPDEEIRQACSNARFLRIKAAVECIGEAIPADDSIREYYFDRVLPRRIESKQV